MRLNRKALIQLIIDYHGPFLELIDYINEHDTPYQVPDSLYLRIYRNQIYKTAEATGDKNAQAHLSLQSLLENGIFQSFNGRSGWLSIEPFVVDLLRYIDINRAKELTDSDLDDLRGRIVQASSNLLAVIRDEERYKDARTTFNTVVNEIASKIRENVERLSLNTEQIAADYQQLTSGGGTQTVIKLLERVTTTYVKYVLPCLQFIDPTLQLKEKRTFSQALDTLIAEIENLGSSYSQLANEIQYAKTRISSYYKDIVIIDAKLRQYTSSLESDRKNYAAIELAYNKLIEEISELRHGKQKNYMLNKSSALSFTTTFNGLFTFKQKYSQLLGWTEHKTPQRFQEYLRTIEAKPAKKNDVPLLPLPPRVDDVKPTRAIEINHCLMQGIPPNDDIYQWLHDRLSSHFEDYTLYDLLTGVEYTLSTHAHQLAFATRSRHQVDDGTYYLDYMPIALTEPAHV